MTVTKESLTLELSMHILCPGANEHIPEYVAFFPAVYMIISRQQNVVQNQNIVIGNC